MKRNPLIRVMNFLILSMFFITACVSPEEKTIPETNQEIVQQEQETEEVKVKMQNNKILIVLARDRYQSLEFNPVNNALIEAGFETIIAGDQLGTAYGTLENTEIQVPFSDINTDDYAGIVIIGGSTSYWNNTELYELVSEFKKEGKLTAAICYGSVVLANAGVIAEGDIACWYNSPESDPVMQENGVIDSNQDVTIVDNVITGDGPDAADEFAKSIVGFLS